MKSSRQNIILEIIEKENIETQADLMEALRQRGIDTTQATLSRDIRELHLVKDSSGSGKARYIRPEINSRAADERLRTILKQSVLKAETARNLIVLKTLPGLAPAACSAFDGMNIDGLAGTIAGDDTCFLAFKDDYLAEMFRLEIETLL